MTPLFFGPAGHRLFGVYHPAAGRGEGGKAMVLCNPWGPEALRAHRGLRALADTLARGGWHVLRFDYFGTGDSEGDDGEGDVDVWTRDTVDAVLELCRLSGATGAVLAGLRLGAAIASLAARGRPDVHGLVLWDPVADGAGYLNDLPAGHEGYGLSPALRRSLSQLTPARCAEALPERVLFVHTNPSPGSIGLRSKLAQRGGRFTLANVTMPPAWRDVTDWGPGPMPTGVIEAVAAWRG